MPTVYRRVTRRALEVLGSLEALAQAVKRPVDEVQCWLSGERTPCAEAFLDLLDIVAYGEVRRES